MKPADKPCYFCGETRKMKNGQMIGGSTWRIMLTCLGCGNTTFHTMLDDTENVIDSKYVSQEEYTLRSPRLLG